jgi:chaperonin GroES
MVKLRPAPKYVVVRMVERQETSKGGIIIPDNAQESPRFATVVAVGNMVEDLRPKEVVLLKEYMGHSIELEGDTVRVVHNKDIIAKVE